MIKEMIAIILVYIAWLPCIYGYYYVVSNLTGWWVTPTLATLTLVGIVSLCITIHDIYIHQFKQ